jgi:hypothetical protein
MTDRDTGTIALSDRLADQVRTHLGATGSTIDMLVPLEDMVTALGDALPLATLSAMLDGYRPGAMVALGADGRLDTGPARRTMRMAA